MSSILDLPEPARSAALARRGMTAEEFAAHQAGREALIAEAQRRFESGEEKASTWQNDEAGSADISVVKDWQPA